MNFWNPDYSISQEKIFLNVTYSNLEWLNHFTDILIAVMGNLSKGTMEAMWSDQQLTRDVAVAVNLNLYFNNNVKFQNLTLDHFLLGNVGYLYLLFTFIHP